MPKKPNNENWRYGNKNAAGHGAPPDNKNAEKHGAYSAAYMKDLPLEEQQYIMSISLNVEDNLLKELQKLTIKECDLQNKIKKLENTQELVVDKIIESESNTTTIKTDPFNRIIKLEAELNKIHGRILKLFDSLKSYKIDNQKIELEEKKYILAKQKLTGIFEIEEENAESEEI